MKEKPLMASFLAGNFTDIGLSGIGLSLDGFTEIGIAASGLVESGRFDQAAMLRTGVTALIIGLYALTESKQNRFAFSFEKSLRISNAIVWSVNAINAAQLLHEFLPHG